MVKTAKGSSKALIVVKGLLVSYILSAIMLLILAFLMYKLDPPSGVISIGIILTYIISAFAGGFILGKNAVQKRYLWGIAMGVLYYVIIFLVALILGKDVFGDLGSTISVFFMCILGGMLGGMIS